jgi:fructose-specific phosphotransferase system IIC component
MEHHQATIIGLLATGGSVTVSFLPEVEAWLRILSLIVGCAVGAISFYKIIKQNKK